MSKLNQILANYFVNHGHRSTIYAICRINGYNMNRAKKHMNHVRRIAYYGHDDLEGVNFDEFKF